MGFLINRVYTRSGDSGMTSLVGGRRVTKADLRVKAYGEIDELNSALGLAKELLPSSCGDIHSLLSSLQQELFDYGSFLSTPSTPGANLYWQPEAEHIEGLERMCDRLGEGLAELSSFVIPGGSPAASALHLARSISRRAERSIIELKLALEAKQEAVGRSPATENSSEQELANESLSPETIQYINRVSDLLFIIARKVIHLEGREEPLWVKGVKGSRLL